MEAPAAQGVTGGGAVGGMCAYHLPGRGRRVTVLDAAATGQLVAELADGATPHVDPSPYRVTRF